jgi:hypothetical protein
VVGVDAPQAEVFEGVANKLPGGPVA